MSNKVKDLAYFLDEVAREKVYAVYQKDHFDDKLSNVVYLSFLSFGDFIGRRGSDTIAYFDVKLQATERWYKQQLEEKNQDIVKQRRLIEEQNKEISHLNGQVKLYSGVYSTITNLERTIENLTQENESLKQK